MSTMGSVPSQSLTGDWLVEAIGGEPVDTTAPRAVRFEADTVAGRVGVNHFTGPFTMGEGVIEVGELVSTLMAGPPELMALEDRFVAHLRGVHGFELEGDELVLGDGERSIRLITAGTISVRGSVTYREDAAAAGQPHQRGARRHVGHGRRADCLRRDHRRLGASGALRLVDRSRQERPTSAWGPGEHPFPSGDAALGDRIADCARIRGRAAGTARATGRLSTATPGASI